MSVDVDISEQAEQGAAVAGQHPDLRDGRQTGADRRPADPPASARTARPRGVPADQDRVAPWARALRGVGGSLLGWVIPALAVVWWYLATRNPADTSQFPSPAQVLSRAGQLWQSGELLSSVGISAARALSGFALGGGIGFLLGVITGLSRLGESVLNTTIQMLRNIPVLALIPLALVWFGIGEQVKIYLVAFGVFFLIYANTYHGIRYADPDLLEMSRVYGQNPWRRFVDVILPGALPSILVGVRLALGVMWLVLIAAETIATDAGIGYMAMTARNIMQMDTVVLSIILYSILGKLSDVAAVILERSLVRWKKL